MNDVNPIALSLVQSHASHQALDAFPLLIFTTYLYQCENYQRYAELSQIIENRRKLKPILRKSFNLSKKQLKFFNKIPLSIINQNHLPYLEHIIKVMAHLSDQYPDMSVFAHEFFVDEQIPLDYVNWFLAGSKQFNVKKLGYQGISRWLDVAHENDLKTYLWFLVKIMGIEPLRSFTVDQAIKNMHYWRDHIKEVNLLIDGVVNQHCPFSTPFSAFSIVESRVSIYPINRLIDLLNTSFRMKNCAWRYHQEIISQERNLWIVEDHGEKSMLSLTAYEEIEHYGTANQPIEDELTQSIVPYLKPENYGFLASNEFNQKHSLIKPIQSQMRALFSEAMPKAMPKKIVLL